MVVRRRKGESLNDFRRRQAEEREKKRESARLSKANRSETDGEITQASDNARYDYERTPRSNKRRQQKRKRDAPENQNQRNVREAGAATREAIMAAADDTDEEVEYAREVVEITTSDLYEKAGPSSRNVSSRQVTSFSSDSSDGPQPGPSSRVNPPKQIKQNPILERPSPGITVALSAVVSTAVQAVANVAEREEQQLDKTASAAKRTELGRKRGPREKRRPKPLAPKRRSVRIAQKTLSPTSFRNLCGSRKRKSANINDGQQEATKARFLEDKPNGNCSSSSSSCLNNNEKQQAEQAPASAPLSTHLEHSGISDSEEILGRLSLSTPPTPPSPFNTAERRIETLFQWRTDEAGVELHSCGEMRFECGSCYARHFMDELTVSTKVHVERLEQMHEVARKEKRISFGMCCSYGQVSLPPLPSYPAVLRELMTGTNSECKNFRENLRPVNNAFAFSCMRANIRQGNIPAGGAAPPQIYVVQGQIYHVTGPANPSNEGVQRQYAQIYILDQSMAMEERLRLDMLGRCQHGYIQRLTEFFHTQNPFAKSYRMLHQVDQDFRQANPGVNNNLCMAIYENRKCDKKNYNRPTANTEVAIIFDNADGLPPDNYDLVVYPRATGPNQAETGNLKTIHYLNPNLEPMSFPILFPFGSQGWGPQKYWKPTTQRYVTANQYYAYRFSVRSKEPHYQPPLTWTSDVETSEDSPPHYPRILDSLSNDYFNPFIHAGRLTHQYMVDAYVRIEASRLSWIRSNQKQLRASSYCGFVDSFGGRGGVEAESGGDARGIGKNIILPSGYLGGPRYMQQMYQDAMAMVVRFGKPDLFITMTCNPKWPEIADHLEQYETHLDRPDLVARVFHLKAKALQTDIIKSGIFGRHLASVDVIEFQKRGLPHMHMLIILGEESKFRTSEDIDDIVSAEIPDETFPQLRQNVLSNMMHVPCGPPRNDKRCRGPTGKEVCKKKFPKSFSNNTIQNVNGYPLYRRRPPAADKPPIVLRLQDGHVEVDNRWVVPYNPYLLLKYNCHINVEVCASAKSVKYIYKYVYKGHDAAYVGLHGETATTERDEIKEYLDARYVSAPEAIWRIFSFPMCRQSHKVRRMAVHLPGQQNVYFDPTEMETEEGRQRVVQRVQQKHTTLTAWFKLNQEDPDAHQYFYWEAPEHYTIQPRSGLWKKRERLAVGEKTIGRMYTVNVRDVERFFLRIILQNEKGFTSFDDILKVRRRRIQRAATQSNDGNQHQNEDDDDHEVIQCLTFRQAAVERGYTTDDTVWTRCLRGAATYQMPTKLRNLFAGICINCGPSSPEDLWREFREALTEDICHRRRVAYNDDKESMDMNMCEQIALAQVREILIRNNYNWSNLDLPFPPSDFIPPPNIAQHQQQATGDSGFEAAMREIINTEQLIISLNQNQRAAYFEIINALDEGLTAAAKCFFLDGPGGSGKTYLYNTLIKALTERDILVLSCATTGIAANLLPNGRTMHSLFGLPPNLTEDSTSSISMESVAAQQLANAGLILLDECTMASAHAVNTIDKLLRDVMALKKKKEELRQVPFGGKVILFGGDFRQCIAIVPRAKEAEIVKSSLKFAKTWPHFRRLTLHQNMRASEDSEYSDWLLKVGNGDPMYGAVAIETGLVLEGGQEPKNRDLIKIPDNMIETGNLVDSIFGDAIQNNEYETISERAILCPKNTHVDRINEEIINRLPGVARSYYSTDLAECEDEAEKESYTMEYLNSINESGLPPHKLSLKKNSIVILLRNYDSQGGLCNGTRLCLINIDNPDVVLARILTGSHKGEVEFIPRISLTSSTNSDLPFTLRRVQFPFKPAFAMTINKAQGQTLDMVGILLPEPVFGHGQLYVALSRVRLRRRVKIKIYNTLQQGRLIQGYNEIFTRNVVYREVLN